MKIKSLTGLALLARETRSLMTGAHSVIEQTAAAHVDRANRALEEAQRSLEHAVEVLATKPDHEIGVSCEKCGKTNNVDDFDVLADGMRWRFNCSCGHTYAKIKLFASTVATLKQIEDKEL